MEKDFTVLKNNNGYIIAGRDNFSSYDVIEGYTVSDISVGDKISYADIKKESVGK